MFDDSDVIARQAKNKEINLTYYLTGMVGLLLAGVFPF